MTKMPTTIGEFMGLPKEVSPTETGTGNKWFVILSTPDEFDDFRVTIRRALENAEKSHDKLKVTVQRIAS
jgi:hypothetical protein